MTDFEPGDAAVAVMVEVARTEGRDLSPAQRLQLERLLGEGLVELAGPGEDRGVSRYKLSRRGQQLLDDRGVGANES